MWVGRPVDGGGAAGSGSGDRSSSADRGGEGGRCCREGAEPLPLPAVAFTLAPSTSAGRCSSSASLTLLIQHITRPSAPPVANHSPSPLKVPTPTAPSCPWMVYSCCPLRMSHSRMVESAPVERRVEPAGWKEREVVGEECAR